MADYNSFKGMLRQAYGNLGWNPTATSGPGGMIADSFLPENIQSGETYAGENEFGESMYTGEDPDWMTQNQTGSSYPSQTTSASTMDDEDESKWDWGNFASSIGEGLMGSAMQNEEYMYDLY
jgi:hypothetical protein